MTEKISLCIKIPTIHRYHDFIVPSSMKITKMISLIVTILSDEYGISKSYNNVILIDMADNKTLIHNCSLKQMGISNGAMLILL